MKIKDILIIIVISAIVCFGVVKTIPKEEKELGNVGNEPYVATSTAQNTVYGAFSADRLIKTGWGTLGSVTISGANTGVVNFYNATTTDVTKRTGNIATSSLLIASLPASLAAGTYDFNAVFTTGLYIDLDTGIMPTTTVTYK
jgi:hypothetical protein